MGLIENNKRIIFFLVCTLFVLCYVMPVAAKSNEEIYQEKLAILKDDDVNGHYELGLWCLKNKLEEQAKTQFSKVLELDPKHKKARQDMDNIIQLEKDAKMAEIIKKYGPYKGVLDKAGADKEKLPWEKAREKETDHFIVKTNLSVDALNDLCFILECVYFTYQDIFGFETPKEKLRVLVSKNQEEYKKIFYDVMGTHPPSGVGGFFSSALNPRNKLKQDHLLSYYNPSERSTMTSRCLHECTHYAIALVSKKYGCPDPTIWLGEGWATYYETSRLEGKKLVTNVIDQVRLSVIKDAINKRTHVKLIDFINLSNAEYIKEDTVHLRYAQGWSLIYFLLNGQNGKYKAGMQAYMEAWKKGKIAMDWPGSGNDRYPKDKTGHLKLFEECMGVPIEQLEKEWKVYILQLK